MKSSIVAPIVSFAVTVAAHGGVLSYNIAGTTYKGFVPYNSPAGQSTIQREWDSYSPIQDPTLSTMACNANGAVGALTATVAAGSKIIAYWNNPWPHTIGPMVTWMASCGGSCLTFEPTGNVWFKIDQAGLESGNLVSGLWGSGQMVAQNSSWTSTIPASLKAGNYLIRHETIALHSSNAPQWYPECAQLVVTGSGTAVPDSSYLAAIPGVYSMSDPEINIDIYANSNADVTTYTIPGPAVWSGTGTGGSSPATSSAPTTLVTKPATTSTPVGTTTKVATTTTKMTTTSTKPAATTTTTSAVGGIAKYGQCGGTGYTGSTTCVSGTTCTYSNAYYSQCL